MTTKKRSLKLNMFDYAGKSVISKMNKLGERMDCLAQGIREHGENLYIHDENLKGTIKILPRQYFI